MSTQASCELYKEARGRKLGFLNALFVIFVLNKTVLTENVKNEEL